MSKDARIYSDTELLDYLESLSLEDYNSSFPVGWKVRRSFTGRGYRLLTTTLAPNYPTVREAIIAVMSGEDEL